MSRSKASGLRGADENKTDDSSAVGGVPAAAFAALVDALTNAITAAVNAVTTSPGSAAGAAKKIKISTAINP
jgi:hypothetical protein